MITPFETKRDRPKVTLLTLLATTTIVAAAGSNALSAPLPLPAAKRLVVWDGEEVTKGSGWVNPKSCTLGPQTVEAHSGKTALEFMFKGGSDGWPGAGWNWCAFQTGRCGTDITSFKRVGKPHPCGA